MKVEHGPSEHKKYSMYYDELVATDDVEIYRDGFVIIEASDYEIHTTLNDLEALVRRARRWQREKE